MKKLLLIFALLTATLSNAQWVIWNNEIYYKTSPTDSINYGPSHLQPMIEVIRNRFENVETNKISVGASIPASTLTVAEGTIGFPFYRRVSGSNATTTGQSLVDVPGLSATLAPSAVYEVEINLTVSTSAVTTGVQYAVNYTAAGATFEGIVEGSTTSTASRKDRYSTLNANSPTLLTTSGMSGGVRITGAIITGANAGDIRVRHLKVTSGTSTVFINSFMKLTRIQ